MPDKILYTVVARGTVVLAEYSTVTGNAHLVAHRILEKLSQEDSRVSYSQERHLFHILVSNGLTFMCMADESIGRRIPFAFLDDIKDRFLSAYADGAATAVAYEYNTDFSRVLQQRCDYFSNDPNADAINRVRGGITEVKNIMVENIEKVLDRGERIELLVDKTDHLQHEAFAFKRESRRLKHKMWWQNARLLAAVFAGVLLGAYIIVAFVCSPTFQCHKK
ncbi:hypothetical protein WJX72_002301 [[Myrmecia] bisecta]|uniref:Uncharacterized protein n=1 Tax=[Myrmecia] bisecta TaxID=41462 RepID=A0AAW1R5Y3_9CHLO